MRTTKHTKNTSNRRNCLVYLVYFVVLPIALHGATLEGSHGYGDGHFEKESNQWTH